MYLNMERNNSWNGNVEEMRWPLPENMSVAIHTGRRQVDLEASIAPIARLTPRSQPRALRRALGKREAIGQKLVWRGAHCFRKVFGKQTRRSRSEWLSCDVPCAEHP